MLWHGLSTGCGGVLLAAVALHAQQTPEDLEQLARNLVGDAVKIPSRKASTLTLVPTVAHQFLFRFQPTVPFPITKDWLRYPAS